MVLFCRVLGCHNRGSRGNDRSFYRLPAVVTGQGEKTQELSEERRRLWLASLNQDFTGKTITNVRVCSDHFVSKRKASLYDRNSPDWVPSVNMASKRPPPLSSREVTDNPHKKRRHMKIELTKPLQDIANVRPSTSQSALEESPTHDSEAQTIMDLNALNSIECDMSELRSENACLKRDEKIKSSLYSVESFVDNDRKVCYITGLPSFKILMVLFNFLEAHLPVTISMGKFECFTMTLARLRLNVSVNYLAFQMNTSVSTISRVITDVIDVMYIRMKCFVMVPEREVLQKTMPIQFHKQFGRKCAYIIDLLEILIERPSNLKARSDAWSSDKHHNTVKFLLGITPQGGVSFVSHSWGGQTSDKHITEHCGFLNRILPGDLILADTGFDIQDGIGGISAQVKIPACTKGKSQLSSLDVESKRCLANVRIPVERVFGLVRQNYRILGGTFPINMVLTKTKDNIPIIDKIVYVCCSLINLCDSVVAFD